MKLRMPNTYLLLFALLVMIAGATWLVPGGQYATHVVGGKTVIDPQSFQHVAARPQGLVELMTAPIKGFVAAAQIIGFVMIVGGAFAVLQRTLALDAFIHAVVNAHHRSAWVRRGLIPLFVLLFSLGGATFGMAEEVLPFVLLFIPLALALGYDRMVGVAIPFVGSQVGFAAAFLNPFNVGVAQGLSGLPLFSGMGYRLVVWAVATTLTIAFLMRYAQRVKAHPALSPCYEEDRERLAQAAEEARTLQDQAPRMSGRHQAVLWLFVATLAAMVVGVVKFQWYVDEIAALFLGMAFVLAVAGRLSADEAVQAFVQGARDLVGTALVIALAKATVILAKDAHIIDTLLHFLAPYVASSSPVWAAQKMFVIQSVINFFIHSGTGQAALTMPIMAPLSDLVGVSRQTAVLAFQLGELSTSVIPTSGVTIGVLQLAGIPWTRWFRWMFKLQLAYFVMALLLLVPPTLWLAW